MAVERADDVTRACNVLREQFARAFEVASVQRLAGGLFSRAYAFSSGGRDYVLRINTAAHADESLAKDEYAGRHFSSPELPIPRVIARGRTDDGFFAISEQAPGRTLAEHTSNERRALLPSLLDTLDAIGRADTRASCGYGHWGSDGNGRSASWRDFLASVIDEETNGFLRGWHALFHESFLEREVYNIVYRHMLRLTEVCPEERALIHNDYWFENILADGPRVTGVIDWANALYGDPLYDVARLSWGSGWAGWWFDDGAALLRERYGAATRYAERIACYECHIALDDLRFYARTGKQAEYTWARDRLLARVNDDAGDT